MRLMSCVIKEEVKQLKIQLAEIKRIASRPIQLKE